MSACKPCPFCGVVPVFKGEPYWINESTTAQYSLPCGCHEIVVYAGSLGDWRKVRNEDEEEWNKIAQARATKEWNESFTYKDPS